MIIQEAVQYPSGGNNQTNVSAWIKRKGGEPKLYDGWVQETKTPHPDGTFYQWSMIFILVDKDNSITAKIGDWICLDESGKFFVLSDEEFLKEK